MSNFLTLEKDINFFSSQTQYFAAKVVLHALIEEHFHRSLKVLYVNSHAKLTTVTCTMLLMLPLINPKHKFGSSFKFSEGIWIVNVKARDVHAHTSIHTGLAFSQTHRQAHRKTRAHTHTHRDTQTYTQTHTDTQTYTQTYTHTHTHTQIHKHIHKHTQIHKHIHKHIYTHTHTHR